MTEDVVYVGTVRIVQSWNKLEEGVARGQGSAEDVVQ